MQPWWGVPYGVPWRTPYLKPPSLLTNTRRACNSWATNLNMKRINCRRVFFSWVFFPNRWVSGFNEDLHDVDEGFSGRDGGNFRLQATRKRRAPDIRPQTETELLQSLQRFHIRGCCAGGLSGRVGQSASMKFTLLCDATVGDAGVGVLHRHGHDRSKLFASTCLRLGDNLYWSNATINSLSILIISASLSTMTFS